MGNDRKQALKALAGRVEFDNGNPDYLMSIGKVP